MLRAKSGNGLRKNPMLRQTIEAEVSVNMQLSANEDEAAIGAALCVAVAGNEFSSITAASQSFVKYENQNS